MSYSEEEQAAFERLKEYAGDRVCALHKRWMQFSTGRSTIEFYVTILPSSCSAGYETADAAVTAVIEIDKKKEEEKNATTTA